MKIRFVFVLSMMIGMTHAIFAADNVDYERDIKPLFAQKCATCHGALKQQAGLRLDAGVLIRKGGENGAVIVPGKAAASVLLRKVTAKDIDKRMPPESEGEPLNAQQIAMLTNWINAGAISPKDEVILADPSKHWAYQPPKHAAVPKVDDPDWSSNPIDAFIADGHQRQGLTAVGLADRHTRLRRAYLDLIGLPPTRRQIASFVADNSPNAWHTTVDSLLASPRYGERWGRHWMDVWRYSDWDGYKEQLRGSQRHIWHWRDWIIQSLNTDKGYDRMIVEMLAADEAAPADAAALAATGFLARNYHKSNRNIWLDATVEHTTKAFLGMTLNCARCHDHKFDPLAQTLYYQFRAIFEPHKVRTDRVPGQPDIMQDGLPRAFDAELTAKTFLYRQGNEKHPDKAHPMTPDVPALLGVPFKIQPISLPVSAYYPALRTFVYKEELAAARKNLAAARKALSGANEKSNGSASTATKNQSDRTLLTLKSTVAGLRLSSLELRHLAEQSKFTGAKPAKLATDDAGSKTQPTADERLARNAARKESALNLALAKLDVLQKQAALKATESTDQKDAKKQQASITAAKKALADATKKLDSAQVATKMPGTQYTPIGKQYPRTSSGRRLALARWITARQNPLTARVAVNHIWMRHFGAPLVDNVFDFGLRTAKPRHAKLLDWLAVELMENNWSMKHLHRLIVTSRTWQLASTAGTPAEIAKRADDPDNHYLWRMNVRRLDAEIIRDNVLAVSGHLDTTMGGADIDFRQGETSRRRSIYLRHAYEKQMTMLVLFDAASPNECYRRSESIIPQQALALTNSTLSLSQSRLLARQIFKEISTTKDASVAEQRFVQAAFLQILSRPPADVELAACTQFLNDQTKALSDTSKLTTFVGGATPKVKPAVAPRQRAMENLVQVLMNHNDFVTIR